jgi:hypothetical protein
VRTTFSAVRGWCLVVGLIFLLTFALDGHNLMGRWRFDDGHHLLFLTQHANFEYLYQIRAARLQSGSHLTPFNILTYDIPHRFFGFSPGGFYAFHLALVAMAGVAFYYLLRRLVSPLAASVAVLIFLAGFPMLGIASQLMVGHYVMGAIFVSLSLTQYDNPLLLGWGPFSALSLVLYFLACLSKEIFLPFAGLILVDPRSPFASRLRLFAWYAAVAAAYWLLRIAVVAQFIGGYNKYESPVIALLTMASGVARYFTVSSAMIALGIACGCTAVVALISARRKFGTRSALLAGAGTVVVAFAPLIAVPAQLGPDAPTEIRLWLAPWFLFSASAAFAFEFAWARLRFAGRSVVASALVLVIACQYIYYERNSPFARIAREFDSVSLAVESGEDCHLVGLYGWSSWIHDLGEALHPGAPNPIAGPRAILDTVLPPGSALCELSDDRVVRSSAVSSQSTCSVTDPMSVALRYDGSNVNFTFGPDKQGFYYVEVSGKYFLSLPPDFFGPMPNTDRLLEFRVLHIAPDGHVACSPELHFEPGKNPVLHFSRTNP